MLEVSELAFNYPDARIKTDFFVARGSAVALMGASGSGKTTILNLIAGFLTPASGDIRFDGQSLLQLSPAERPLTYLFQQHNLFPHLSVWQNLALGISPQLKIDAPGRSAIEQALEQVGLAGFDQRKPGALSGGQQQRVALARCLLRRRPLLLLDEPFSALDQDLREQMLALILQLQERLQLALVVSTHQQSDATVLDARVIRIEATTAGPD